MQNAVIIYYLLFCEKYLLMNGAGYGYIHLLQFLFDQYLIFFLLTKILNQKDSTSESRESFDIFVSPILHPRVNSSLFSCQNYKIINIIFIFKYI